MSTDYADYYVFPLGLFECFSYKNPDTGKCTWFPGFCPQAINAPCIAFGKLETMLTGEEVIQCFLTKKLGLGKRVSTCWYHYFKAKYLHIFTPGDRLLHSGYPFCVFFPFSLDAIRMYLYRFVPPSRSEQVQCPVSALRQQYFMWYRGYYVHGVVIYAGD